MPDYEKGTPAWDIGMVLTRHGDGLIKNQLGRFEMCARVAELKRTAMTGIPGRVRLEQALAVACTCGAGDADSERSSIKGADNDGPTV